MATNKLKNLACLVLYTVCAPIATNAIAKPLPYSETFTKHLEKVFKANGKASARKINSYKASVKKRKVEHYQNLYNYYRLEKNYSDQVAKKKASGKKEIRIYNKLLLLIESLKHLKSDVDFALTANKVLDISEALKSEGPDFSRFMPFLNMIKVESNGEPASNLFNEKTNDYWSEDQLKETKKDISKLNPKNGSGYWTDNSIENYVVDRTYNKHSGLYKNVNIVWPSTNSVNFKRVRRTQTSPKLDVTAKIGGIKYDYKLKFNREIHAEPSSAALFAAVGFNTDPSRYVKNLKMYLGDVTEREFRREFANYYRDANISKAISRWGNDSNGRYAVFKEALLEAKPKTNTRIGAWSWGYPGRSDLREVRGLNIMNLWVGNKDLKEAINNKIVMREDQGDKLYYVAHDLGSGYGKNFTESADTFSWDAIRSVKKDGINLNIYSLYKGSAYKNLTIEDGKWIIRKIAKLSKSQIADAFKVGGWPSGPAAVLTEKLSNRRNQLVSAFGLSNEFKPLPVNKKLTTADGAVRNGKIDLGRLKEKPTWVAGEWERLFEEIFLTMEKLAVRGAIGYGAGELDSITFDLPDVGVEMPFRGRVLFGLKRSVSTNYEPTDANDRYIVKDTIKVGLSLGTGWGTGINGNVKLFREFNLYYGVADKKLSHRNADYLGALLRPFAPGSAKLPKKYTLIIEDYLAGEGSIKLSSGKTVEIRPELSISKVYLNRLIVSDKDTDTISIFEDDAVYTELALKLKLAIAFIEFDFFKASTKRGKLTRNYWEISVSENKKNKRFHEAMAAIRKYADTRHLDNIKSHSTTLSLFKTRQKEFNFLNLVYNRKTNKNQNIETWNHGKNPWYEKTLQLEIREESGWNGLYQGERRIGNAFFVGIEDSEKKYKDPVLGINIFVEDRGADSKELADIIKMVNTAADDFGFIKLSPELHSRDHFWGTVWAYLDILFYKEAIDHLLTVSSQELLDSFFETTGRTEFQWDMAERDNRPEAAVYKEFKDAVSRINKAQRQSSHDQKMKYLVRAINEAFINRAGSIKSQALAAISNVIDEDSKFIGARLTAPHYEETIFPGGKPMVNTKGKLRHIDARLKDFDLNDPSKVYNLFDTAYRTNDIVPSRRTRDVRYKFKNYLH